MYIDKGILETFTNVTIGFHHCIKSPPVFYNNDIKPSYKPRFQAHIWESLRTKFPSFSPFVNTFQ
jgi:hypothetical protein